MNLLSRAFQVAGAFFLAVTLVSAIASTPREGIQIARWSYLLAAIALFTYNILNARRGGVSLMISFFFLFFMAVPAFLQIEAGVFPFYATYTPAQLVNGYAILSVAQLSYAAVEAAADGRARPTSAQLGAPMRPSFYRRAAGVIFLASLGAVAYLGPGVIRTRAEVGSEGSSSDNSALQILFIGRSISLVAALICLHLLLRDRQSRRLPGFLALSALIFTAFLILNYPPGLSRFQLLGSTIAVVAILTSFFRRSRKMAFAVGAPLFLFFLFPAVKELGRGNDIDIVDAIQRDVGAYLLRVDFDGFKQTVDTWLYVSGGASQRFGENFLGVLLFWVPRSLWPGKPLDSGGIVSADLGYRYTNVSSPLPAEAYISFGYLGVIAVFAGLALFVTVLERRVRAAESSGELRPEPLLLALTMGYVTIVLRGALNGVAPMFMTAFLLYFILIALHSWSAPIIGKRMRSGAASAAQIRVAAGSKVS